MSRPAFTWGSSLDPCLTERFRTRFQPVRLQQPDNEPLAAFPARRWGAPPADSPITRRITEGARGDAGAALEDLERWMGRILSAE